MCILRGDVLLASHINLFCWILLSYSRAQHSTAQQGRPAHSKASLKAWQTSKSHSTAVHWNAHTQHSTAMQHCAQQRSATHSTMSTENTRARCFACTAQSYSGILHVPVIFIMALQLGICLRGSDVSSRMGQLKTSMIRRRSKESIYIYIYIYIYI